VARHEDDGGGRDDHFDDDDDHDDGDDDDELQPPFPSGQVFRFQVQRAIKIANEHLMEDRPRVAKALLTG
jgi:hypothetical protein